MKKILILIAVMSAFAFQSCHREGFPSGEMTSEQLKSNPASAEYMTLGNYAMFKEPMAYFGEEKDWPEMKNTYIRHYFFMTEFRGDNIALCYLTSDNLTQAVTYSDGADLDRMKNNIYMWWVAYRIIYGANAVIESLTEGVSNEFDHIIGENYFLRAICHLHLVNLYAKPYSHGVNNPGVVIRKSTDTSVTERATVGMVYEQIEADLKEAIRLMGKSSAPRESSKAFASKAAAQGLLSRVYLYMGRNEEVITLVDEMLGGAAASTKLTTKLGAYFASTLNATETLWAVGQTANDLGDTPTSKIAAMYYKDENGIGYGEIAYADPLLDLYNRYPQDERLQLCFTRTPSSAAPGAMQIRYVILQPSGEGQIGLHSQAMDAVWDANAEKYYFMDKTTKVFLETETVPGTDATNGYTRNYIMLNGVKTEARIAPVVTWNSTYNFPEYFMIKFSNQDGIGMMSSPPMIRWGEVILNRAEAYAKTNQAANALADVNAVRGRAGLTGDALFTEANYTGRGYASVLDVVLDERRLELCFEGHRAIDQFRNNKPLDRRYIGAHFWEIIQPDDPRFPYRIPNDEIRVSGIPQNE